MTEQKLQEAIALREQINSLREHAKRVEKVLNDIKGAPSESNHAPYLKLERNNYQNGGFVFQEGFLNENPQEFVASYLERVQNRIHVLQDLFATL